LGIVALVLLQLQTRIPWLRALPPAKGIRRPSLQVQPLGDDALTLRLGPSVAGLIRGRVTWKTDRFGLNLVSGQAGIASALSGLSDVSAEAKGAVAVINFLTAVLPRRRFTMQGQLQPAGAEGVGISLELSQNGGACAVISFWADPLDLKADGGVRDYHHLAVACAAWVDIWMAKSLDGDALLTGDPQSWAFFRVGVDAQRLGDSGRARTLYEQALAKDGSNVGAMANLGILARRERHYEEAENYLTRAKTATEQLKLAPKIEHRFNLDWYRIRYQFAALYTNWATDAEDEVLKTQRRQDAATHARVVAQTALDTLTQLSKRHRREQPPAKFLQATLKPFLEGTIVPSVLVLVASTVNPLPDPEANWFDQHPDSGDVRAQLDAQTIDPWLLIAFVEHGDNRPPALLYNLACFYTRSYDLGTAAKRLIASVRETLPAERQALIDVASHDPTLEPLRVKRPGMIAKLREMVAPAVPDESAEELRQGFDRQDRVCRSLQSAGWTVQWDADDSRFDLKASRGGQLRVVEFAPPQRLGRNEVQATIGGLTQIEHEDPDAANAEAWVIIPPDVDNPDYDLAEARDLHVYFCKDTEHGLIHLK
jgi:tetratricopeptide (TPR) repeat protein